MLNNLGKFIRTLTRPLVTISLVAAVVGLAFMGKVEGKEVVTLATAATAFWFASRSSDTRV